MPKTFVSRSALSLAVVTLLIDARATAADDVAPTVAELQRQYEDYALTHAGDPFRGAKLFNSDQRAKCAVCHRIGKYGGQVGPELTVIGGKFDRPHLVESLLEPSRQIVEGFRTSTLQTSDGRALVGIVREAPGGQLQVAGVDGKVVELRADEVESRQPSDKSLMPEGLATQLSREEFTDLVAYLESLRPGGKVTPGAGIAGAIELPAGFRMSVVVKGLSGATALECLPDGRILVAEQAGQLRLVADGKLLPEPVVTLPVDSTWERGLLGVTIDPDFAQNQFIYVVWVAKEPYPHHRLSRFTLRGNVAETGSELVLLEGDDQRQLGGKVQAGHQGGAIHFGPDGKLYVALGEQTAELPAQKLDTLQGKLLRLNRDGSVPDDNPFVADTSGKYRAIWARGCRNPYTFAFDRATGTMLINDVGGKFEKINRGAAGANYGWPLVEHGPTSAPGMTGAIHTYPQASIAGGDFAPHGKTWPEAYRGQYFFADFVHGWIKTLDPARPERVSTFASGLRRPVDFRFGDDGALYVLLRNAWVIDGKFVAGTGSLLKITPPRMK
ncbi:MAG: PQQ-dependent sugar dehydrogenase [Planctomycetes bacterium]|nr:PQQ-dependent sugar dehydrogenase [Planctomycetota bacterium]